MANPVAPSDFTVGWVCALPIELAAAIKIMDERFPNLDPHPTDSNSYSFGRVGAHNVVVACLPAGQMGTNSAATVASRMETSFPSLRFSLLVGIGGGVPNPNDGDIDIRLGDVVISQPVGRYGGVIQYDFGKTGASGRIARNGSLNAPPPVLLNALAKLRANEYLGETQIHTHLSKLSSLPNFVSPGPENDTLYQASSPHVGGTTCAKCCLGDVVDRYVRATTDPVLFYGNIASGNQVIKDGVTRDRYSQELEGVLCFEMEAAGLMNNFPCLVIRGICDYADAHKNKRWQPYAAATAAACAKELLYTIPPLASAASHGLKNGKVTHVIPLPQNKRFVEREETHEIMQMLFDQKCQKVALVGLGGVGKTQISLHIAYLAKEKRPEYSVFWVPVYSRASFEQAYTEIAKQLNISPTTEDEDLMTCVNRFLSSEKTGPWLLIVDNADDIDILFGGQDKQGGLMEYLPENDHGLTLFTSRSKDIALSVADDAFIELHAMKEEEATRLLEKSLHRKRLINNDALLATLLELLTYLPLAITQAAAYLNRNSHVSLEKYLKLLQGTEQTLVSIMSREFRDSTRYTASQNAIATTWLVSFDQIRRTDSYATQLLRFISRIEPKSIPQSILPRPGPDVDIEDAIGTLCSYAFLVQRDEDETFDMHSLVHMATRVWVRQQLLEDETAKNAIQQLHEVFPSDDHWNRAVWRQYLPHALRILRESTEFEKDEKFDLFLQVGRCLGRDGRLKEAVRSLEEAYELRKGFSVEDVSRLTSQHELARAYRADGRVKEAIELLKHVVKVKATTLDEGHLSRLASQHELARAYRADGRVKEAIELLEHVVKVEATTLDEGHLSRLASQHVLARAYQADGRVKEAIELLEHVVKVREMTLDEGHPSRLTSQHTLAMAYRADGRVKETIELLEHVAKVEATILDEGHPDRLASQHMLVVAYQTDGRAKEAVKIGD
ncbi:Kinesin light chain 6 [Colletotrichum chlorophyti]|uniref:Kinesin light chain 6 n=1 Tax=Colletotrichum chlorophyti TaxID=708187 RepID=A0A1Q8S889_9PEZI|nr:Kinesin light chain 6 [Colletotrichum chlorophyti]